MARLDLTGDGYSDIIWRSSTGIFGFWDITAGVPTWQLIGNVPVDTFEFLGAGQVNGTGGQDIYWYYRQTVSSVPGGGGSVTVTEDDGLGYWGMTNGQVLSWTNLEGPNRSQSSGNPPEPVQGNPLVIHYADGADFNGDGRSDYVVQAGGTYSVRVITAAGSPVSTWAGAPGDVWDLTDLADFTGDGTTDMLWRNTSTNEIGIYTMQNGVVQSWTSFGFITQDWEVAATADLTGDGRADIVWHNLNSNQYGLWKLAPSGSTVAPVWTDIGVIPGDWQIQDTGDYYGDGSEDIAWRSTSTNAVQLWNYAGGVLVSGQVIGSAPADWQIV